MKSLPLGDRVLRRDRGSRAALSRGARRDLMETTRQMWRDCDQRSANAGEAWRIGKVTGFTICHLLCDICATPEG
ncbi:MAG: hypothetical protein ACRDL7_05215 [Gaiellaceae bacterium]